MNPSDDMDISLFIEPQTGVILQAFQLIQINTVVRRNPNFRELAHLRNITYLPISYINSSTFVSESVANSIMSTLIVPQMSITVAASLMITASLVSLIVIVSLLIYRRCSVTQHTSEAGREENAPLIVECASDSPDILNF